MITACLQGGLGNQMFQIAAAHDLAVRNDDISLFNLDKCHTPMQGNKSITYHENIYHKLKHSKNLTIEKEFTETSSHYKPIPYFPNLRINGYFQSEKYFDRNRILNLFEIDNNSFTYLNKNYLELFNESCISLQVRRGDYLKLKNKFYVQDLSYFESALSLFDKSDLIIVVSDDIEWCKLNLSKLNRKIKYIDTEPDHICLNIMRFCKNNIISNSTFGWWGAWLNTYKNKKVVSPKKWYGVLKTNLISEDLLPKEWIRI